MTVWISCGLLKVTCELKEAVAIAMMIGADDQRIVGWVYQWNTGALAIRWQAQGPQKVFELRPELNDAQKQEIKFASLTNLPCHTR